MPKLKLKRTPSEQFEHELRKATRKIRTSIRRSHSAARADSGSHNESCDLSGPCSCRRRRHRSSDGRKEKGHHPLKPPSQEEIQERRFREKILGALEDDEGLHFIEARLNEYAHVPDRWQSGDAKRGRSRWRVDDESEVDPQNMSDEEYAEYIRVGMWRRTHVMEHAEQLQQKALKDARRAHEQALKAEAAKLEKAAEEERRRKRLERERRRWDEARKVYDGRWKALLGDGEDGNTLKFGDVPWPLMNAHARADETGRRVITVTIEDLTEEAISAFLLPRSSESKNQESGEIEKKVRKERLRETILRFHPDKFEGRFMSRVKEDERAKVRDAVGQVVRVLNTLMANA